MANAVGGLISVTVDGVRRLAKGNWRFNLGDTMKSGVMGADGPHGYRETPQQPFIEGEITVDEAMKLGDVTAIRNAEVILQHAGKTYVWREAWYAGEGTVETDEGNMGVRFEAIAAEEL